MEEFYPSWSPEVLRDSVKKISEANGWNPEQGVRDSITGMLSSYPYPHVYVLDRILIDHRMERFWAELERWSEENAEEFANDLYHEIAYAYLGPREFDLLPHGERSERLEKLASECDQLVEKFSEFGTTTKSVLQEILNREFGAEAALKSYSSLSVELILSELAEKFRSMKEYEGYISNISRKDSRINIIYFIRFMQVRMKRRFGMYLDGQIATLVNVLFDSDVDKEYVKNKRMKFTFPDAGHEQVYLGFKI